MRLSQLEAEECLFADLYLMERNSSLIDLSLQLEEMRKNEDPRLSFSTPEFKEAQRIFTDGFKVDSELTTTL